MPMGAEKIEVYFDRQAQPFDELYSEQRTWRYVANRWLRRALYQRVRLTVAALQGLQDFSVLDVGCGSGRNSVAFLKSGARRVVGIDLSENMIRLAREYARGLGVGSQCEFIRADALACPFQERFDVAVALGVFDYIEDPRDILRRMAQLADEIVIASFPRWSPVRAPLRKLRYWMRDCPVHFFNQKRLQQISRDAGLRDCEFLPLSGRAGWLLVGRVSQ